MRITKFGGQRGERREGVKDQNLYLSRHIINCSDIDLSFKSENVAL